MNFVGIASKSRQRVILTNVQAVKQQNTAMQPAKKMTG